MTTVAVHAKTHGTCVWGFGGPRGWEHIELDVEEVFLGLPGADSDTFLGYLIFMFDISRGDYQEGFSTIQPSPSPSSPSPSTSNQQPSKPFASNQPPVDSPTPSPSGGKHSRLSGQWLEGIRWALLLLMPVIWNH